MGVTPSYAWFLIMVAPFSPPLYPLTLITSPSPPHPYHPHPHHLTFITSPSPLSPPIPHLFTFITTLTTSLPLTLITSRLSSSHPRHPFPHHHLTPSPLSPPSPLHYPHPYHPSPSPPYHPHPLQSDGAKLRGAEKFSQVFKIVLRGDVEAAEIDGYRRKRCMWEYIRVYRSVQECTGVYKRVYKSRTGVFQ